MDRDRRILALAVIVSAVAMVAPFLSGDVSGDDPQPDPEPATDVTAYGYVLNISNAANIPLAGVSVKLLSTSYEEIGTTVTDENGRFEFTFEKDAGKYLTFTLQGYTVRSLPEHLDLSDDDLVSFDLADDLLDDDGKYAFSRSGDTTHVVGMSITSSLLFGTVLGTNGGNPFSVEGARVVAVSSTGQTYSAWTNPEGYFEVDVLYGSYSVYVQCNGFKTSETVTASTDGTSIVVTLVENDFGIGILGGLDAPHALMVIGLIVIGVILLFSMLAIHRSRRPESGIVIVNDVEALEGEEEEKIIHP